ncbi:MAG: D-sedoheptulose 7-phosphate isomerase [Zetaproteobacteria bacterium]|nr:D-sedoheptulose 7-phosphate isomerase [Zetaproteobacteria bacterium]
MREIIREAMEAGIDLRRACLDSLEEPLLKAADAMVTCLKGGGKILVCGNGGSAADAQHFAGELVNRFELNRPGLAAVAMTHDASVITSIANDFSFDDIFSRQVEALGREGDLLLAISTSGNSANVIKAATAAEGIGMKTVALTGYDGGLLGRHSGVSVHLNIAHSSTPRVQEMHITSLHIICSLVDEMMFGGSS